MSASRPSTPAEAPDPHPSLPTPGRPAVVLLDLDGVVWLAHQPIDGSVAAIARLRAAGVRVLFVTNNSSATVEDQAAVLGGLGIPADGDVVTSAMAGAQLVAPGERVLVCGGPGVTQAIERRGAHAVDDGPCDAVVVGFHRDFSYERLRRAATAVMGGARLIGTNDDATYPTPDGPIPGGGAILAAVEVGSGTRAVVAGKPFAPMAALVRALLGGDGDGDTNAALVSATIAGAVMVGDRPSTDGRFARELGCRYAQVWSGVTPAGTAVDPVPDLVADDLAGVVAQLLGPETHESV